MINLADMIFPKSQEKNLSQSEQAALELAKGMIDIQDAIAPGAVEIDFNYVLIDGWYYRTLFISGYPRFVGANWLSSIVNFEHSLDISMFYYPIKSRDILDDLRKKITELETQRAIDKENGKIPDAAVEAALSDAQNLQDQLVKGVEKFFQISFYLTIPAQTLEELNYVTADLMQSLATLLLIPKVASLQMEEAFSSCIPQGLDKLMITRNMDTTSIATTFPFTSSMLSSDEGIMYGINKLNNSLVIFDRFSMPNSNSVVFATSGSGKSYLIKLEALRYLVQGVEIVVIDPESEYKALCETVGGNFISFSANSPSKLNPFDLSLSVEENEDVLDSKITIIHTMIQLMVGQLSPTETSLLDKALSEAYRLKGITKDPETQVGKEPPLMEDLYKVLQGSNEPDARILTDKLSRYVIGSLGGIFNSQSNIKIDSKMTVFSVQSLEDVLKPLAFFMILDFIWTKIKKDLKKRILIVEEAWYLMQREDSAKFLYGLVKRARKYFLGVTCITQDVDDFLKTPQGLAVITNSAIVILLKQVDASIDSVGKVFNLSEGEKRRLLAAGVGEGIFFAGRNHVWIQVKASKEEHEVITTNPEELLKKKQLANQTSQQPTIKTEPTPTPSTNTENQNQVTTGANFFN
jgi:type IV secretory pathway VirB4 component